MPTDVPAACEEGTLRNPLDPEEFRSHAHRLVDFIADYYASIESVSVRSRVEPGYLSPLLPLEAPEKPEPLHRILEDVERLILPGVTHWQSPRFFAYYPANSSTAGLLGDMLGAALNVVGFSWVASPAATELEMHVLDDLAQLLGLPPAFMHRNSGGIGGGVIQGTASEAVLVALLAARERALKLLTGQGTAAEGSLSLIAGGDARAGPNTGRAGGSGGRPLSHGAALERLVAFTSDEAHSCVKKACQVAGVSPANLRLVPTSAATAYAMDPLALEAAVRDAVAEGLTPFFISATVGTTSSAAVDPIPEISHIAKAHGAWLHVDAAYAGSACVCPEFQHLLSGVEGADSLCINAHKWLLTNFDCSCLWVQDSRPIVSALSTAPEYLRNQASDAGLVVDFKDWQVPLGRRFRSLKLWFVLRMYGASGLRNHIRRHVALARMFEDHIREDPRFEVVAPPILGLICFRLLPSGTYPLGAADAEPPTSSSSSSSSQWLAHARKLNKELLECINGSGRFFLTHTVLPEQGFVLRFAIGATLTEERHVAEAWAALQAAATALLDGNL